MPGGAQALCRGSGDPSAALTQRLGNRCGAPPERGGAV